MDSETITLVDARSKTTVVSDRPERSVRRISNETFAGVWGEGEDSFANAPPNAIISVADHRPAIVVLSGIEVGSDTITYRYELLDGRLPYSSGPATIVIDDYGFGEECKTCLGE